MGRGSVCQYGFTVISHFPLWLGDRFASLFCINEAISVLYRLYYAKNVLIKTALTCRGLGRTLLGHWYWILWQFLQENTDFFVIIVVKNILCIFNTIFLSILLHIVQTAIHSTVVLKLNVSNKGPILANTNQTWCDIEFHTTLKTLSSRGIISQCFLSRFETHPGLTAGLVL